MERLELGLVDADLVRRAREEPDAFAVIYRCYVSRVHAFAYKRTGSVEAAEEITAATFEKAWRGLDGFEWRGGGFAPWLFRIASNETISHYRRNRRRRVDTDLQLAELAHDLASDEDLAKLLAADESAHQLRRLRSALGNLNERYQEVISLRYLAELTPEEAAAAMGCTKATLAVVLHRALKALRKELATLPVTASEARR